MQFTLKYQFYSPRQTSIHKLWNQNHSLTDDWK